MRFAGSAISDFMGDTNDYSKISGTAMDARSMERKATMMGEGMVANAGVKSLGAMRSAEAQADSIAAQGKAQGQASMMSGLMSGIGSFVGGFGGLGGGASGGERLGGPAGPGGYRAPAASMPKFTNYNFKW